MATRWGHVACAKALIDDVMGQGRAFIVAWSGGKDSSAVVGLVLAVAAERRAQGLPVPQLIVTHADPGIENPEVARIARQDYRAMRAWAKDHGLELVTKISFPNLNDQWAVRVIGGRDLPVFAGVGSNRKCTQDFKIKPQERLVRELVADLRAQGVEPVTVTGTRFAESTIRSGNMAARGETASGVWYSDKGEARLSPIADWSDVDLWAYLHACARGEFASYSDFSDLIRLYRDGSDPADVRTVDDVEVYACRFGCALCTAGKDKSMAWLLRNDPARYGYMAGLHRLQRFLLDTQHDLARRQWLNFRITDDGYAMLRPNTYSPSMLAELLRYCLTLDVLEDERTGGRPLFQLVPMDALVAIDAIFSLQGHHPAHHALRVYREVVMERRLAEIPEVQPAPKTPVPEPRYAYVGIEWQDDFWRYSGLRDLAGEMHDETCPGAPGRRVLTDGREVMAVNLDTNFTVDPEAAGMLLDFELEHLLDNPVTLAGWRTSAFNYYARMGIIALAKGSHASKIDHILRRTMWKEREGLLGLDQRTNPGRLDELLARAMTKRELAALRASQAGAPGPKTVGVRYREEQVSLLGLAV